MREGALATPGCPTRGSPKVGGAALSRSSGLSGSACVGQGLCRMSARLSARLSRLPRAGGQPGQPGTTHEKRNIVLNLGGLFDNSLSRFPAFLLDQTLQAHKRGP